MLLRDAIQTPDTQFEVEAVIRDVGNTEFSRKSRAEYVTCRLDDGEQTMAVKIYKGNNEVPTLANVEQKATFTLKGWRSPRNNKVYVSGFWNNNDGVQDSSQASQGSSQSTDAPKGNIPTDLRCRALAIDAASRLFVGGNVSSYSTLYDQADQIVEYIETGKHPTEAATGNPIDEDFPEEP